MWLAERFFFACVTGHLEGHSHPLALGPPGGPLSSPSAALGQWGALGGSVLTPTGQASDLDSQQLTADPREPQGLTLENVFCPILHTAIPAVRSHRASKVAGSCLPFLAFCEQTTTYQHSLWGNVGSLSRSVLSLRARPASLC